MKKVVKLFVTAVFLCLTVMSCSKENLVEQDVLYETQATEGDTGSAEEQRDG